MKTIYSHLRNLKFDKSSAEFVEGRIKGLSREFNNQRQAIYTFVDTFPVYVNNLFSNAQLDKFVKIVRKDAFSPRDFELEEELGWSWEDFNMLNRDGILTEMDKKEYFNEKKAYIDKTRDSRELHTLNRLEEGEFYNILTCINYRNVEPSEGNFDSTPVRCISIPMGGAPGYKLKRKVR